MTRVLFASSSAWGYVVPALTELTDLHTNRGYAGATLLCRDRAGIERAAAHKWTRLGNPVETITDLQAAVTPDLDVVWAWIANRDPEPVAALHAALDLGIPALLRFEGRYPYRPGSEQWLGAHPAQIAERARQTRQRRIEKIRQWKAREAA